MVLVNLGLVRGPSVQFLWFLGIVSQWVDCGLPVIVPSGFGDCFVGFRTVVSFVR